MGEMARSSGALRCRAGVAPHRRRAAERGALGGDARAEGRADGRGGTRGRPGVSVNTDRQSPRMATAGTGDACSPAHRRVCSRRSCRLYDAARFAAFVARARRRSGRTVARWGRRWASPPATSPRGCRRALADHRRGRVSRGFGGDRADHDESGRGSIRRWSGRCSTGSRLEVARTGTTSGTSLPDRLPITRSDHLAALEEHERRDRRDAVLHRHFARSLVRVRASPP